MFPLQPSIARQSILLVGVGGRREKDDGGRRTCRGFKAEFILGERGGREEGACRPGGSLSREQGKGAGEGISGKRERRYRVFSVVSEFLNSSANIGLRRGDRDDVSGTRESWGMGGGLGGGGHLLHCT